MILFINCEYGCIGYLGVLGDGDSVQTGMVRVNKRYQAIVLETKTYFFSPLSSKKDSNRAGAFITLHTRRSTVGIDK